MKEKILQLRKQGLTVSQIVAELNCAKSTVSYHINKNGLGGAIDSFISDVSVEIIEQIKELKKQEKTYSEILSEVDITEDRLKRICRILNLNQPVKNFKPIILEKDLVIEVYLKLKSLLKTANYFNVSITVIRKYITDDVIDIKKRNKKSNSNSVMDFRKNVKIKLVEYKGGCCEVCGYNKSIQALQFHHKNPNEKDFQISGKSYSFEKMKVEVDKCMLVCSNCHIEIHELERNKLAP